MDGAERITPVAHGGKYVLESLGYRHSDGWRSRIHLLGESIILVAPSKRSQDDENEYRTNFHLQVPTTGPAQFIHRGQVPYVLQEHGSQIIPRSYSIGQSSVLTTTCSSQLRSMWTPRWTERVFFLSINVDSTSGTPQIASLLDIKRALPAHRRTKPYECRLMTSTDAFSGRTAHMICPGTDFYAAPSRLAECEKEIHVYESFYGDHPYKISGRPDSDCGY
ncbi:hypothetical protein DL96DRAFT_1716898 [Flagelloscypha sp. PMI_526]|nr:hypothetical protein DL96DRAFT_1716898 [Flagelloscypha sp. PMI_526]